LGIVFWVGWQSLQRRGASLMLLPIVMAVIYTFGPLTWLINASEELNLWVNSMPTLLFFAGTLFVSSLLFAFQLTLPKLPKLPERKEVPEEDQKRKARRSKPKAAKAKPTKPARTKAARTKTPAPTLRNARVRPNAKNQRRSSKRP